MNRTIALVEDLRGGEVVELHAGVVRVVDWEGDRWGVLLAADLSETPSRIWLPPNARVLRVLEPAQRGGPV